MSENNFIAPSLQLPPYLPVFWTGMPVGSIVAFAGEIRTDPNDMSPNKTNLELFGWLLCDGKSIKKGDYPELFQVLGYRYGGHSANFNVPDYRGLFLRCVDNDSQQCGSNEDRKAPQNGDTNSVGSTQGFALQDHQHEYKEHQTGALVPADPPVGEGIASIEMPKSTNWSINNKPKVSSKETRPVNCYVYYLIKARHS